MSKKFSINDRLKSFAYAWAGLQQVFSSEHNMWIHLVLTMSAGLFGLLLHISRIEWMLLIIVIALVWMAELFNTAIEKIMDFTSREKHPQIKIIKDVSGSGSVDSFIRSTAHRLHHFPSKNILKDDQIIEKKFCFIQTLFQQDGGAATFAGVVPIQHSLSFIRVLYTKELLFLSLIWNLFLAFFPLQ
jgi:diacylglycerol kinase